MAVSQAPKLGQSPARRSSRRSHNRSARIKQGMVPAINSLKKTLADMIRAYQKASTNYAETEAIIAQSLKGH